MPTDPKWRGIAKRSGRSVSEVIAIFNFVMVNASANATERGRTHNLFADDIGAALDMEEADVKAILDAMQGKVLDGGVLTGWETRQPKREDNSASRAKVWREKQKAERNRTQPNAKKRPDTDIDTDIIKRESNAPATLIDPDFSPLLTPNAEKIVKAWPEGMLDSQLFSFINHAQANARTQSDWQAAFRTWIGRAEQERKTKNAANDRSSSASRNRGGKKSGFAAAIDERLAVLAANEAH